MDFSRCVITDWVSLMSGIASLAAWFAGYFSQTTDPNLAYKILWPAAMALMSVAFFRAWRRKNDDCIAESNARAAAEDLNHPDLRLKIVGLIRTNMGDPPRPHLVIMAEVRNFGAPSIVDTYIIELRSGARTTFCEAGMFPGQLNLQQGKDFVLPVFDSDYLPIKTSTPIERGAKAVGHVITKNMDLTDDELRDYSIIMRVSDVRGKVYEASWHHPADGENISEFHFLPGTTVKVIPPRTDL